MGGLFHNEPLNPTTILIFLWPEDITCCFHYCFLLSFGSPAPLQLTWLGPQSFQKHTASIIPVLCKACLYLWQGKGCRTVSCDSQMKPAAYYFHVCNFKPNYVSWKANLWPLFDKESIYNYFYLHFALLAWKSDHKCDLVVSSHSANFAAKLITTVWKICLNGSLHCSCQGYQIRDQKSVGPPPIGH